jgi:hypothetical protein
MKNKFQYGEDQLTVGKSLKICSGEIEGSVGAHAKSNIIKCKNAVDQNP